MDIPRFENKVKDIDVLKAFSSSYPGLEGLKDSI